MARKLEEVADAALSLERESRAALAKRLLDSLDEPSVDDVGEGWIAEAQRRYDGLKGGSARTSSAEEVLAKLERKASR